MKSIETETISKSQERIIAFEHGRIVILKRLRDKLDGDHYSIMRQFPDFQRSSDDKSYSLPTISWNAKICRVYKIEQLHSIRWHNHKLLLELNKKRYTWFYRHSKN